ncbi:MAG: hypothetical protein JSS38_16555 [Nitrospira sp.]|nr:hypothetical protein [Nitrospira sp.]
MSPMRSQLILVSSLAVLVVAAILVGCATTEVDISPSPQTPVCDNAASALVLWAPQWRPDQKDVPKREVAAEAGLKEFLQTSGCFASSDLRRLPNLTPAEVGAEVASTHGRFNRMVTITLNELGPVIRLLASLTLVDGGTEAAFQIAEYMLPSETPTRTFTVHWRHGGPGVVKGVISLPQDMHDALVVGLQPNKLQP